MGKSSKKSGEAAPAGVVKATKPLKKAKREPEDGNMQTKTNLKKQKKDVVIETMEGLSDRLQRIESKFDMLMTKVDLLISANAEISSSEDDESSSSDEDSEEKTVASVISNDEDQGEKAEQRKADSYPMIGIVSNRGRWPFGGRYSGGRCGGRGLCGRC